MTVVVVVAAVVVVVIVVTSSVVVSVVVPGYRQHLSNIYDQSVQYYVAKDDL